MDIRFICVGKLKSKELQILVHDYLERLQHYASARCIEVKDSTPQEESKALLKKSEATFRVVLSEEGRQYTSVAFATFMKSLTKDVSFIIGGPEGLSPDVKKHADILLSLSTMTLPHELTRVILMEQVYRAYTIIKKERYHK